MFADDIGITQPLKAEKVRMCGLQVREKVATNENTSSYLDIKCRTMAKYVICDFTFKCI